jgi:hypothetical protein
MNHVCRQGTRSAAFLRQAMEPATPSLRLSSATLLKPVLAAGRRSNASKATQIRGVPPQLRAPNFTAGPPQDMLSPSSRLG